MVVLLDDKCLSDIHNINKFKNVTFITFQPYKIKLYKSITKLNNVKLCKYIGDVIEDLDF